VRGWDARAPRRHRQLTRAVVSTCQSICRRNVTIYQRRVPRHRRHVHTVHQYWMRWTKQATGRSNAHHYASCLQPACQLESHEMNIQCQKLSFYVCGMMDDANFVTFIASFGCVISPQDVLPFRNNLRSRTGSTLNLRVHTVRGQLAD